MTVNWQRQQVRAGILFINRKLHVRMIGFIGYRLKVLPSCYRGIVKQVPLEVSPRQFNPEYTWRKIQECEH